MRLINVVVRNATPQEKPYKLVNGRGLYVLVNKVGKYFPWDYRFAGKRKTLALGVYPEISLKETCEKHEDLRSLLARDIDPMEIKKQKKAKTQAEVENTFEFVAREWFVKNNAVWTAKHADTIISCLQNNIVPLSLQAITVLKEIQPLTGNGKYVFPSLRSGGRPMSNNTILAALRIMGYTKKEMTGHGFRAMASTMLHEQGRSSDVIERQLAHRERNSVKAAYNHAQYLPERRRMMQVWADYLDSLRYRFTL